MLNNSNEKTNAISSQTKILTVWILLYFSRQPRDLDLPHDHPSLMQQENRKYVNWGKLSQEQDLLHQQHQAGLYLTHHINLTKIGTSLIPPITTMGAWWEAFKAFLQRSKAASTERFRSEKSDTRCLRPIVGELPEVFPYSLQWVTNTNPSTARSSTLSYSYTLF